MSTIRHFAVDIPIPTRMDPEDVPESLLLPYATGIHDAIELANCMIQKPPATPPGCQRRIGPLVEARVFVGFDPIEDTWVCRIDVLAKPKDQAVPA